MLRFFGCLLLLCKNSPANLCVWVSHSLCFLKPFELACAFHVGLEVLQWNHKSMSLQVRHGCRGLLWSFLLSCPSCTVGNCTRNLFPDQRRSMKLSSSPVPVQPLSDGKDLHQTHCDIGNETLTNVSHRIHCQAAKVGSCN